jgi:hypothetical protein
METIANILVYTFIAMIGLTLLALLLTVAIIWLNSIALAIREIIRFIRREPDPYPDSGFFATIFWSFLEPFGITRPRWKWPKIKFDLTVEELRRD